MWNNTDTIAAVATPPGRGGVGIIRISGPDVPVIAKQILGFCPPPNQATHRRFLSADHQTLDDGIALYFKAPYSFTGEDVLELQGHGGQVVLDMVLQRCLELGARIARPGEYSERAFLNDKLDLAQAEAIADLIDSGSEQAARSALRSLQGAFSDVINQVVKTIIEFRVYVEAALDFPDEEIDFLADNSVRECLAEIKQEISKIFDQARQGSILREGMHLVIVGRPNAGKSSLLNVLAGNEAAIVTDVAGTTRDILREKINLDGMPLHIIDTAGLHDSHDPVEKIGIARAWQEIEKADLLLVVADDNDSEASKQQLLSQLPQNLPSLLVCNKIDLTDSVAGKHNEVIYISVKNKQGITALCDELKSCMDYQSNAEDVFIARRRHLDALQQAQEAVNRAEYQLLEFNAGELMAEELRLAQDALATITGEFTPDDLLGEIFSSFCIGK
ncbi:MAG: tRNA uridine-5-carboxymethylaminomethyl(34) synthesis GTPase MnmE [Thiolinea sp.]